MTDLLKNLYPTIFKAVFLLLAISIGKAEPAQQLAPTPPMGWNSWNWFAKQSINEQVVKEVIDAMATNGLRDAGYDYVIVDGGWRDTKLGPNGELLAHPEKFPHGMKSLADYAHSRGFKFGLHTVPGTHDCGGDPVGGFGHEEVQVKQFVDWGIDFIKLDKCHNDEGWNSELLKATYTKWGNLLAHCGRPIVLSISAYAWRDWYPQVGQMGRTTPDIRAHHHPSGAVFDGLKNSVMDIADQNNKWAAFAGHGYWNDPDMLVTGNQGLTQEEQKAHFALWCVMSAPLMLGNDPRSMTKEEKEIVLNRDCIAIDQDATEQGRRIKKEGGLEVWAKKLTGGRMAVVLLNRSNEETNSVSVNWKELGLSGAMNVKDVLGKTDLGSQTDLLSKPTAPHACWLLLLSPVMPAPTSQSSRILTPLPDLNKSYQSATAETKDGLLHVSTGQMARTWKWTGKGLVTTSLKDSVSSKEWLETTARGADWNLGDLGDGRLTSLKAFTDDDEHFTSKHLTVEAEIHYAKLDIRYVIWAYPDAPGIRTQLWLKKPEGAAWTEPAFGSDVSESFDLSSLPESVTAFGYRAGLKCDVKPYEILKEKKIDEHASVDWASGLVVEGGDSGIVLIKESQLHADLKKAALETGAFTRNGSQVEVTGLGLRVPDLKTDSFRFCWANWTILYRGDNPSAQLALKQFDRARFPVHPSRDIFIMANTWGTEDAKAQCRYEAREENVLREITACADLGIDVLQIDSGWQQGGEWRDAIWRPAAEASGNFTLHTGEKVSGTYKVYPNGFGHVRDEAAKAGVKLGLWNASVVPIADLKANYDAGNFKAFKLDFANLKEKDQLDGLYFKARNLIKHSDYSAAVNWDVTEASPRMGFYFGRDCGNLYLSNRKAITVRPSVQYDPFKVLRDAWELAMYINLNKIQITFQNKDLTPPGTQSDALKYGHEYNLGITLMSNPIFFTETQYLDEAARKELKAVLQPYKTEREQMYAGYVFAIGNKPDNGSWTGFQNYDPKTGNGYLTVFRELHNQEPSAKIALDFYPPGTQLEFTDLLSEKKRSITLDGEGRAAFMIPKAPGFQFVKVSGFKLR